MNEHKSVNSYVNPFIGTDGAGNCLVGPYLPFSLVRLGPDTQYPQPTSGYQSDQPIIRFSHTHVSGTGGGGRYGNLGVTPLEGKSEFPPGIVEYERDQEQAEPGYYRVRLEPAGIVAELTVTPRVGLHRYTFPQDKQSNILIDLGAVIQTEYGVAGIDTGLSTGGWVEFISAFEVVGRGDFRGGWGHAFPYSVYFYARFDQPIITALVAGERVLENGRVADGPNCKALAGFGACPVINVQVGISFVSVAKARASVEREVGEVGFDQIRQRAAEIWERALSRILVEGGETSQKTLFYTMLTRLLCMPTDLGIDDENPLWQSGVRHFWDFYCLWDSVRNANSLLTLLDPELEVAFLNCLLDIAEHTGWLPDAWITGHSAQLQGGSSADILFCEAALNGLEGIDYPKALRQMRKNNEVTSPDPTRYGRYLKDYLALGYVSTDVKKSCVSRHLEYTYQDWCIGRLAEQLGQAEVARQYEQSSHKVWNLWNDQKCGFAPRHPDGSWAAPFEIDQVLAERWEDPYFYEGTSRQWSFNVQHDFEGLIRRHGCDQPFVDWLDQFFDGGFFEPKETMLHVPYLYIYAGRPDKTARRVRECLTKYFRASRGGLSDNEDMGCQSAWYICSSLGLYPVMGQAIYLLTTPVFNCSEISLGNSGNRLIIETPAASPDKPYIVGAKLNNTPLNRAWLTHQEITNGAILQFQTSSTANDWGTKEKPTFTTKF